MGTTALRSRVNAVKVKEADGEAEKEAGVVKAEEITMTPGTKEEVTEADTVEVTEVVVTVTGMNPTNKVENKQQKRLQKPNKHFYLDPTILIHPTHHGLTKMDTT